MGGANRSGTDARWAAAYHAKDMGVVSAAPKDDPLPDHRSNHHAASPADDRLEQLLARLRPLVSRRKGAAVVLAGPPGIGKTTLAAQALGSVGCRYLSLPANVGLARLVRELPRPDALPAWARLGLERAAGGEAVEQAALVGAVSAALQRSAPFVLHVDDLHEAPPELAAMLHVLAGACRRTPGVGLLVASRQFHGEPFDELWLEPLGEDAASALLGATLGGPVPTAAAEWVYARAGGNPLFTLEYQRQLARGGFLWSDGRRWNWREPPAGVRPARVEAVIEHVVAHAKGDSAAAAAAVEARALLPVGEPDMRLWGEVAGLTDAELTAQSARLHRLGLLRRGDFSHGLVRELTVATLPAGRRKDMAARAVASLGSDPVAAAHFVEAADLPAGQALDLLLAAAAVAPYKADRARLLARAAQYAQGEVRARLAYEAATLLIDFDLPAAFSLLEQAASGPGAEPRMVRAHAHALARQGRLDAVRDLAAGLAAAGTPARDVADLLVTSFNAAGDHRSALEVWRTNPRLNESPGFELLRAAAASALATGDMGLAEELLARGASGDLSDELRCEFISLRALVAYHRGDFEASEAIVGEAVGLLRGMDRPRLLSTALLNRAAFLKQLSRFQEMNASLEECLRLRSETLDGRSYAFAQAALAELRIDQARFAEAEDLLEEALETQELYGPSRFLVNTLSMTSVLHLARGEPLLAWHYAERSLQLARETSGPRVVREILFDAAAASARMGDGAKALALAEEMTALGPETGASLIDECRARWAKGLALAAVGDAAAAATELRAALVVARGGGLALEANKVAVDLAAAEGDAAAAAAALAWFDGNGLGVGRVLVGRAFPGLLGSGSTADEPAPMGSATAGQGVTGHGFHAQSAGGVTGPGAAEGAELRLEVLGDMRLGPIGGAEAVKGEQRRLLLACLLQARMDGRSEVTDLDLIEALYPSIPEPDAVRALKQLVHQVRRKYGTRVVTRTPGGYALGAGVGSDAERFLAVAEDTGSRGAERGVAAGRAVAADAGATEALAAWRGPFLKDVPEAREDGVAARLTEVAARVAGRAVGFRPTDAARVAQYLQDVAPFEPRLAALEVEARERAGDPSGAAAALARAQRRLAEVGERLDARELERLRAGLGAGS